MRYAVVGSRRFPNNGQVEQCVFEIFMDSDQHTIVSGHCQGPDRWAEEQADKLGMPTLIFPAKWQEPCEHKNCLVKDGNFFYYRCKGFQRNQDIVDNCDVVYAFVVDGKGGTWDTINKAMKAGKYVFIAYPGEELIAYIG